METLRTVWRTGRIEVSDISLSKVEATIFRSGCCFINIIIAIVIIISSEVFKSVNLHYQYWQCLHHNFFFFRLSYQFIVIVVIIVVITIIIIVIIILILACRLSDQCVLLFHLLWSTSSCCGGADCQMGGTGCR